jgi:hypothetical protein
MPTNRGSKNKLMSRLALLSIWPVYREYFGAYCDQMANMRMPRLFLTTCIGRSQPRERRLTKYSNLGCRTFPSMQSQLRPFTPQFALVAGVRGRKTPVSNQMVKSGFERPFPTIQKLLGLNGKAIPMFLAPSQFLQRPGKTCPTDTTADLPPLCAALRLRSIAD